MRREAYLTITAALGAVLALPPVAMAGHQSSATNKDQMGSGSLGHGLVIREQGSISYVSGGIGNDQQNALARVASQFNMKLTMATSDGKYIGGGDVRIEDQQGNTVLETRSDGPMFYAKLPPGSYKVHVNAEGKSFTRDVSVKGAGQSQVTMTWPSSRDEPPIRAGDAPERKR